MGVGPIRTLVEGLSVRRLTSEVRAAESVSLGDDRYSILYVIDGRATVEGNRMVTDDALIFRGTNEAEVELSAGTDVFQVSLALHPSYTPVRGR